MPHGRGFDTSLGFFNFGCDHYTQIRGSAGRRLSEVDESDVQCKGVDLWKTDKPAYGYNGTYSGITFSNEVQRVITGHDTTVPLFLYIAWQNNHAPLEVPQEYEDRCNQGLAKNTRLYCGMTAFLDEAMGNMTTTLKSRGMWNNTLVWSGRHGRGRFFSLIQPLLSFLLRLLLFLFLFVGRVLRR